MAHTPGPWTVDLTSCRLIVSAPKEGYITRDVCRMDGSTMAAVMQRDNARLIASSPRLLAALEALCRQHPQGGCLGEYDLGYPEELEEAWAAIQEATGKPFDRWAK